MPTTDELRERITKACEAAKAAGWLIMPGGFRLGEHDKACCALGAVSIDVNDAGYVRVIRERLGVSDGWLASFGFGFDGDKNHRSNDPDAYALGQEFRQRYLKAD